jgi:uncharacterized membrane protein (DUF2068 family)
MLYGVEGVGLALGERWAEWLTVVATGLLIPIEIYEVLFHFSVLKLLVLIGNVLIVAYLVWLLRRTPGGALVVGEKKDPRTPLALRSGA